MSSKQIEANRRNAQKSTGPRTAKGKAAAKMNAVKHGILSKEVLVSGMQIRESRRELERLSARFWEELDPIGPVEEMLVGQIVTTHWRLRRALLAESGEIALSVDGGAWKRSRPNPELTWMKWEAFGDPILRMQDSMMGTNVIERHIGDLRRDVEREGELTESAIQRMVQRFGGKPNSLTCELEEFRLKLQENPEGLDPVALRARNRERALAFLNARGSHLHWWRCRCYKREQKEEAARQAAAVLPSAEVLEKINRYETKLERQMYRAMAQLERLQRMRKGEAIPAPMSVQVS